MNEATITSSGSGPALECDIVMAGGVTSGVVYPGAVVAIARRYRFRAIGGASVGALVAAAVAAAEYGRRTGKNPTAFQTIATQPAFLGAATEDGRTRLFHLFAAQAQTAPLFRLVAPLFASSSAWARIGGAAAATLRAPAIAAPVIVAALVGLGAAAQLWPSHPIGAAVAALAALALGVVTWIAMTVGHLRKVWLPAWRANNYGLCTGYDARADDETPSLTGWLHALVQSLARRGPNDSPLTFGELWTLADTPDGADETGERQIDLAMVTSDLSHGRSAQLPFIESPWPLYVDADTLRRMFPTAIAHWIETHPGRASDPRVVVPDGTIRLPAPRDLPIVFAARLSLSFPVLLSATPLWTPDYRNAREGRIPLHRVWFSDGGLTSNFPLHFFDSPLPSRPTFCLNLVDAQADAPVEKGDARAAENSTSRARQAREPSSSVDDADAWRFVSMLRRNAVALPAYAPFDTAQGAGALAFFGAILNTARFWNDNQLLLAPGMRERIVNIALREDEGGLNLNMPARTLAELDRRGKAAGELIAARFDPDERVDPKTGGPNEPAFPNHRWVRYRNFMAAFEELSRRYASALRRSDAAAKARGEPDIAAMIDGDARGLIGYPAPARARPFFHWATGAFDDLARAMAARTQADRFATFDRRRRADPVRAANRRVARDGAAAPRPKMRLRLRPMVDSDPRAEFADPPERIEPQPGTDA
ncbi:MAG: patatin-like phospholipase family protein [Rhizobiales bacterium]|nr:patatin-like phospholipase family protein [Hyphomicrobiales bacterium]